MLINMPSGTYDSANIILGDGNGKNIWSIIFPNEKTLDKLSKLDIVKEYKDILFGFVNYLELRDK